MDDQRRTTTISLFDPRIFSTVTLVVIQLSIWAAIGMAGGGWVVVHLAALEKFGALIRPLIRDEHEYWRLFTAMFLHGDISHLLLNLVPLLFFGSRVELALGRARYLFVYFASGLAGNLVSLVFGNPGTMSVGASGAIFGIIVVYFMIETRLRSRWRNVARQPASRVLFFLLGLLLALSFLDRRIDSFGHLGGAATGLALGLFLNVPGSIAPQRQRLALAGWICVMAALAPFAAQPITGVKGHVRAGLYYTETGRYSRAVRHFDAATALDRTHAVVVLDQSFSRLLPPYQRRMGILEALSLMNVGEQAVDYYRQRASLKPSADRFRLLAELGQLPQVADYEAAISACSEGKERFPEKEPWDIIEMQAHAAFRHYDKALDFLEDLRATTGSVYAEHWQVAALCHLRKRDWAQADYATSRCLNSQWREFPGLDIPDRRLAVQELRWRTLVELGRTSQSETLRADMEAEWRRMAARAGDGAIGANNLAWFLVMHGGDLDEAAKLATRSVEKEPEAYNLDTLAWVEFKRGNHDKAWSAMERALADPRSKDPGFCYRAAAILHALDRNDEARSYVKRALDYGLDFDDYNDAEQLLRKLGP